jgi:hypothetical protein
VLEVPKVPEVLEVPTVLVPTLPGASAEGAERACLHSAFCILHFAFHNRTCQPPLQAGHDYVFV